MDAEIFVEGFLLRGGAASVRLVLGDLSLEIDAADVLAVEELAPPDGLDGFAIPVRVHLRRGTRLFGLSGSEAYRPLLYRRRQPFALSTRSERGAMPESPRFRRLEGRFLRERGIEPKKR